MKKLKDLKKGDRVYLVKVSNSVGAWIEINYVCKDLHKYEYDLSTTVLEFDDHIDAECPAILFLIDEELEGTGYDNLFTTIEEAHKHYASKADEAIAILNASIKKKENEIQGLLRETQRIIDECKNIKLIEK